MFVSVEKSYAKYSQSIESFENNWREQRIHAESRHIWNSNAIKFIAEANQLNYRSFTLILFTKYFMLIVGNIQSEKWF